MLTALLVAVIIVLIGINLLLWKSGFVKDAEQPIPVMDRPVMDPKERKAILKRLRRWKKEGKLTPAEFEHFYRLCEAEWG